MHKLMKLWISLRERVLNNLARVDSVNKHHSLARVDNLNNVNNLAKVDNLNNLAKVDNVNK